MEDPGFSEKRRQGGGVGLKKGHIFSLQGPSFYLALDLHSVIGAKFGTHTNMLLVSARRLPRGVESGPLVFGGIQCESVQFTSFRWGAAKIVPEHWPWGGSDSPTWRAEG